MPIKKDVDQGTAKATQVIFGKGDLQMGVGERGRQLVFVIGQQTEQKGEEVFMSGDVVELVFDHPENVDEVMHQLNIAKKALTKYIRKLPTRRR